MWAAATPGEGPVFEVVDGPSSGGVTCLRARADLDRASVERARAELARLFVPGPGPRRLLVHLGGDCFVDLAGLRLLREVAGQAQQGGGALAVVAPPRCLTRMLSCLELVAQLPVVDSVAPTARPGRARTDRPP